MIIRENDNWVWKSSSTIITENKGRYFIGASTILSILDQNPWKSLFEVVAEKKGFIPYPEGDWSTEFGTNEEHNIVDKIKDMLISYLKIKDVEIYESPFKYANVNTPYLGGYIDRIIKVINHDETEEYMVLEIKTSFLHNKNRKWGGVQGLETKEVPYGYYLQVQTYMYTLGLTKSVICVQFHEKKGEEVIINESPYFHKVERDEECISMILDKVNEVYNTYLIDDCPKVLPTPKSEKDLQISTDIQMKQLLNIMNNEE